MCRHIWFLITHFHLSHQNEKKLHFVCNFALPIPTVTAATRTTRAPHENSQFIIHYYYSYWSGERRTQMHVQDWRGAACICSSFVSISITFLLVMSAADLKGCGKFTKHSTLACFGAETTTPKWAGDLRTILCRPWTAAYHEELVFQTEKDRVAYCRITESIKIQKPTSAYLHPSLRTCHTIRIYTFSCLTGGLLTLINLSMLWTDETVEERVLSIWNGNKGWHGKWSCVIENA